MKEPFLYKKYKEIFGILEQSPPDRVWGNISLHLDKKATKWSFKKLKYIVFLLCVTGSGGVIFSHFYTKTAPLPAIASMQSASSIQHSNIQQSAINNQQSAVGNRQSAIDNRQSAIGTNQQSRQNNRDRSIINNQQSTIQHPLSSIQNPESNTQYLESNFPDYALSSLPRNNSGHFLRDEFMEKIRLSENTQTPFPKNYDLLPVGFYGGATMLYQRTWLLNYDLYKDITTGSSYQSIPVYGSGYGLIAGRNFSDFRCLQIEFLLKSNYGTKSRIAGDVENNKRSVNLVYSQINILLKKKYPCAVLNRYPASVNLMVGPYYADLQNQTVSDNDIHPAHKTTYSIYDAGLNTGIEYELGINDNLMLTGGIRTSLGLVNIFEGDGKTPKDFNRTYNFAMGVHGGIRYMLFP